MSVFLVRCLTLCFAGLLLAPCAQALALPTVIRHLTAHPVSGDLPLEVYVPPDEFLSSLPSRPHVPHFIAVTLLQPFSQPMFTGDALFHAPQKPSLSPQSNAIAQTLSHDPAWEPLITRLEADGLDVAEVTGYFAALGPKSYSPAYMATKIAELHGVGGIGISRKEDDAPIIPEGYEQPLSDFTIGSCKEFIAKYSKEFEDIEKQYGVPARTIVGLLLVETGLGIDLGSDVALRALAGMAATTTPELLGSGGNMSQPRRVGAQALAATLRNKSDWAYNEVKALIRYGKATGVDISKIPGSMYGAIGICQFMPSNVEPFGADGNKDGKVDLFSIVDAMYSVASYLEANGWRRAKNPQQEFMVIRTYNHDNFYAARVLGASNQISLALKGKVHPSRSPLAGVGPVPASALDPSLRRARRIPLGARIKSLGSYDSLLK